jgi:hypothetical protein
MVFGYAQDKLDNFSLYEDFHTDIIISELFIEKSSIINGIKIFINLVHQGDIILHRIGVILGIYVGIPGYGIFGYTYLEKTEIVGLFESVFLYLSYEKNPP